MYKTLNQFLNNCDNVSDVINYDFKKNEKLVKLVPVNYGNRFQANTRLGILTTTT